MKLSKAYFTATLSKPQDHHYLWASITELHLRDTSINAIPQTSKYSVQTIELDMAYVISMTQKRHCMEEHYRWLFVLCSYHIHFPELRMEYIFIQQSLTFPSSLFPMFFCWECYLLPPPQLLAMLIKTLLSAAGFPLLCCLKSPAHPWECKLVTKKQYNWHIYAKSSHINFKINVLRSAKILLKFWFAVALYL